MMHSGLQFFNWQRPSLLQGEIFLSALFQVCLTGVTLVLLQSHSDLSPCGNFWQRTMFQF